MKKTLPLNLLSFINFGTALMWSHPQPKTKILIIPDKQFGCKDTLHNLNCELFRSTQIRLAKNPYICPNKSHSNIID